MLHRRQYRLRVCCFKTPVVDPRHVVVQNPGNVKAGEEVLRLTKKVATVETEVLAKQAQARRQADDVAKLQADLGKIKAGGHPTVTSRPGHLGLPV